MCTAQRVSAADVWYTHSYTHTGNIYTAAARQAESVTLKDPSLRDPHQVNVAMIKC